jgi:hypothetical protein
MGLTNRHASAEAGTSHESVLLASIRAFFDGDGITAARYLVRTKLVLETSVIQSATFAMKRQGQGDGLGVHCLHDM